MRRRAKILAAVAAVTVAAFIPLYGDPRSAPVTHAEWARMLLNALDLNDVVEPAGHASLAFSILSWKNSLSFRADNYLRASNVEVLETPRRVVAQADGGEVVYPVAIVRAGDYRLRLRVAGSPTRPATAEIALTGEHAPAGVFTVTPAALTGWLDAGTAHLDPGAYTTAVMLPSGTTLEQLELAPPCLNAVEPVGGWRTAAITTNKDVAVTAIKAIDREAELPIAGDPIEVFGTDFFPTAGGVVSSSKSQGLWLKAGPLGLQAVVYVSLREAGLYSVSVFGVEGGGQSWRADACRKAVLCASPRRKTEPEWRTVLTGEFGAGRHFFTVALGPGAAVERLRLERKKQTEADYLDTIRRLGFDPGPDGPVARSKAIEAMEWIRKKRTEIPDEACGDPTLVAANVEGGGTGTNIPQTPNIVVPPVVPPPIPPGPPPIVPIVVPPQPPASPTTP